MSTTASDGERIEQTVTNWPGVSAAPHRFGGREYLVAGREFGHTHGDQQVDIPYPVVLREILIRAGRTSRHHLYPDSGWVSFYLGRDGPVEDAVGLLRVAYLWHVASLQRRDEPSLAAVDVRTELAALDAGVEVEAVFERVFAEESATR
jgi:hypothetical protein